MVTIATLSQKGGVGKTTLTLHWAVELSKTGNAVAVLDSDPQGTAVEWSRLREVKDAPFVLDAVGQQLGDVLDSCRANAVAYAFVDSRPGVDSDIAEAARLADLVVIPCGPTMPDIQGIGATVGIVHKINRPAVIVLNRARAGRSAVNDQAAQFLASSYRIPVCPIHVVNRAALADAFSTGRAVCEFERNGKAAQEITASWQWITQQMKPRRKTLRYGKGKEGPVPKTARANKSSTG